MKRTKMFVTASLVLAASVLTSLSVHAEVCEGTEAKCGTVATGAAVAVGSGIHGMLKYSKADGFMKANTQTLADFSGHPQALDSSRIQSIANDLGEGDRVALIYNLSEAENRQHHVELMESNASSSRAAASIHRANAAAAMIGRFETETYIDGQGRTQTRQVWRGPDLLAAASHTALASSAEEDAARWADKAADARHGGPVPIYDFEHVVEEKTGTRDLASGFMKERVHAGGAIKKISVLKAAQFAQYKTLIRSARGGLVGMAVGAAVVVEEATAGVVANKIQEKIDENRGSTDFSQYRDYRRRNVNQ